MKFIVEAASERGSGSTKPPLPSAKLELIGRPCYPSLEPSICWTIEIRDLEYLLDCIAHSNNDFVIERDWDTTGLPRIVIYDDYLE